MCTLTHITLLTGHAATFDRGTVRDDVLMQLQPLVDLGQGAVPATRLLVDILRPIDSRTSRPINGSAGFILFWERRAHETQVARCMVCWLEATSRDAWDLACVAQRASGDAAHPLSRRPSTVPWLATALSAQTEIMPREEMAALGDLTRSLAWTIIETPL
ncbi:hypothetical protein [Rhodomicrobium lacus]|uniref:hypothetical protein n=1 Tax=Rhodomicrobium lacus TaxID=2498452 RepID=UPI000F8C93A5|nr:hypothetical protein [Rhodomicrobium lacus]